MSKDITKQPDDTVDSMAGSVHYRLEGLEARSDFWRGLSSWDKSTEEPFKDKGFYEEVNKAENLGWRGFRIAKRTIEAMEPNATSETEENRGENCEY